MKLLNRIYFALAVLLLSIAAAPAQTVLPLPIQLDQNAVVDFGNGPLRFKALSGQGAVFTSSGSGVGTAAGTTALTLAASAAATPPCVGCSITGSGIPAGTTVTAFNGTTGVTLSASATLTSQPVSWGMACPSTMNGQKLALLGPGADLPFWTTARLCGGAAPGQAGAQVLTSAVNTVQ